MTQKTGNLRKMIYVSILLAIMLILFVTPLGFIQIGAIAMTTIHIPVIVGSILLGWKYGATLGGIFGLLSMYRATTVPSPTSFVFSPFVPVPGTASGDLRSLLVSIVPRILIGVTPALVILLFKKNAKIKNTFGFAVAGFVGSLTNTILVLGAMGLIFGERLGYVGIGAILKLIGITIASNGIFESLLASLVSMALANVFVFSFQKLNFKNN